MAYADAGLREVHNLSFDIMLLYICRFVSRETDPCKFRQKSDVRFGKILHTDIDMQKKKIHTA